MDLNRPIFIFAFFVFIYIIIYVITYNLNRRKVIKRKYDAIGEMNYLIAKFKLDKKNIQYKKEIKIISVINSFIIASVGTFVTILNIPMFLQLAIGFIMLFALIYSLYEIYGRHLENTQRRMKK